MSSIYDTLMALPLFQGISRVLLAELIEKVRFDFEKYQDGDTIVQAGDPCNTLCFIVSGEARVDIPFVNKKIHILETIEGPNVICPENLYGQNPSQLVNVKAHGVCGTMRLQKADYFNMVKKDEVFLFNILNYLSRNNQATYSNFLALNRGTVPEKLSFLITSLTHAGSKDITLAFRRKDMCTMLGVKRTTFYAALEAMKAEGYIDFTQNEILVIDRSRLFEILKPKDAFEIGALKAKNL